MSPTPPWVSCAEACWTHVYRGSRVLRASCVCLGSNGHYLLTDWPKWCRSNSADLHRLQDCRICSITAVHRCSGTCGTRADGTCSATFGPSIIPSPHSCISRISGSDDKGSRISPSLWGQPAIKASLKLITGLRNVEDRNHCRLLKRLSTLTRREPQVLVLWLSFIRQVSAGGDERAGEGGRGCICRFSRVQ